ncbi:MAG: FkbM family methyltransferase [Humidesulfovibrio sp.]|nr:FkbM family methyltransferase [Humidesulfovibrio sp.]
MTVPASRFTASFPGRCIDALSFYSKAPKNSRIAIYGAGFAGDSFREYVLKYRSDVTVVCYIDTFNEGSRNGLPVKRVDQICDIKDIDFIVVCSTLSLEIKGILRYFGEDRYVLVARDPKYPSKYVDRHRSRFQDVLEMFNKDSDRALYAMLLDYSWNVDLPPDYFFDQVAALGGNKCYLDNINTNAVKVAVDGGANNGDTASHFLENFSDLQELHCFDVQYSQDEFYALSKLSAADVRIKYRQLGLSDKIEVQHIVNPRAGGGVRISKDAIKNEAISCVSLDVYAEENGNVKIDYIKLDIEGGEYEAVNGMRKTIARCRPQLAICIYHDLDDMWSIPLLLKELCPDYVFGLGHYGFNINETVVYAVPKELSSF